MAAEIPCSHQKSEVEAVLLLSSCQKTVPVNSTGWEMATFREESLSFLWMFKTIGKKLWKNNLWKFMKCSGSLSQNTFELKFFEAEEYLRRYCCLLALCQLLLEMGHCLRKTFGLCWCSSYYVHTLKINFWNGTRKKQKLKNSHLPIYVFKQARLIDTWHAFIQCLNWAGTILENLISIQHPFNFLFFPIHLMPNEILVSLYNW